MIRNYDKVGNFITSSLRHVAEGLPKASEEEKERRLEICRGCEFFDNDKHPKCKKCGCFLNIKTSWAGESCIIKKW